MSEDQYDITRQAEAGDQVERQGEWLPIESAPTDGRVVDLWAAERERYEASRIADCQFIKGHWVHCRTIFDDENEDDLAPLYGATHWMPLPKPPARVIPDTGLVCTACRCRAGRAPDCPRADEPWPTISV